MDGESWGAKLAQSLAVACPCPCFLLYLCLIDGMLLSGCLTFGAAQLISGLEDDTLTALLKVSTKHSPGKGLNQ